MTDEAVIAATRRWMADLVVGLNLCPFARRVADAGLVRYAVTPAADPDGLLAALAAELATLVNAPREVVETTLLVHPHALPDFLDYNDFLTDADRLLARLGLRGVVQVAGFHPRYRFAGTRPDAAENYTNRSPFPMLHLLREASVTEAAGDDPDRLLAIPRRNVEVLRGLGAAEVKRRLAAAAGG